MAAAIQQHETRDSTATPGPASGETSSTSATESKPAESPEPERVPDAAAGQEPDTDFEEVWAEVRSRVEKAQQALHNPPSFSSFNDIQRAIDELRATLAQAPISLHAPGDESDRIADTARTDPGELARDSAGQLDAHLAAVDTAYAEAQSADHPLMHDERVGIRAIHTAVHNLWDTIKAAAGTYWTQFTADARIHGLLTTLATRAARAIATLANAAADRLEERTSPQPPNTAPAEPTLRETYINARSHIRAHAASHEWQRITALWNTVNTLARQTDDPGIRAVVARSADAISDHADSLSRKTTQHGNQHDVTDALASLARAAERHAAALRGTEPKPHGPSQSQIAANDASLTSGAPRSHRGADAQALQATARQVAQRVQARLGQAPSRASNPPRRSVAASSPNGQHIAAQPMQPAARREQGTLHAR